MTNINIKLFFLLLLGGVFSIAKTQNYDSIVSKIYANNNILETDTTEGGGKQALGNWIEFYENRLDENSNIDTYVENLNAYYQNSNESDVDLHWEYIGHTNNYHHDDMTMHGLIMKIWVDTISSTHILAGTAKNGLWETYDNGDNWLCISDSEPRIKGIASLEVINDTIFIGTNSNEDGVAYYTQGLFYTTDHGQTWMEQIVKWNGEIQYPTSSSEKTIRQWIHYPENHNIQFLLTNNYLLKSINNGSTFDTVFYKPTIGKKWYTPWYASNTMRKILFNPNNSHELFIAGPELLRVSIPEDGSIGEIIENLSDSLLINNSDSLLLCTDIGASKINPEIFWFSALDTLGNFDFIKYNDFTNTYERYASPANLSLSYFLKQIEISPFDDNLFSVGDNYNEFLSVNDENQLTKSSEAVIHIDIRASKLYNENGHLVQFQGTDGGIGKLIFSDTSIYNNSQLEDITNDGTNGIINYDMRGFDVSEGSEDDMMLLAQDHNGVALVKNGDNWSSVYPGMNDGKHCQFSKTNPYEVYMTASDFGKIYFLNAETENSHLIYTFINSAWNDLYTFEISPNDSRKVYTGEAGKLIAINCQDMYNIVYDEFELTHTVKPLHYAAKEAQPFVYVSTNQYKGQDSILYKFEDNPYSGLIINKDMTTAINSISVPDGAKITSITLDPFNSNRFWISFGRVSEFPKIWMTEDDGDSFTPYSDGLPNQFPVNEVLFDRLTQRLYAANDVGVFYYGTYEEKWKSLNGDLPPIYCNFIRFSPDHRSLRLGSRSRGPWEASLCFFEENNPIEITSAKAWNYPMHVNSDINIYDGGTLFITDTAYISSEARIRIHSGGKLILINGKLTSLCDERWQGIEVAEGGELRIENGIIENAEVAIRNYLATIPFTNYGGRINIVTSSFINNRKVADFQNDFSTNNINFFGSVQQDTILIYNNIIINENYIGNELPSNHFEIKNAFIHFNFIKATNTSTFNAGTLLYAQNAHITSKFISVDNFDRAYYLTNSNNHIVIKNSSFANTKRAIYANNCSQLKIQNDTLYLPTSSGMSANTYGIYLENCTDYEVKDNLFIGDPNNGKGGTPGPPEEKAHIGLYVNNSGAGENIINNNYFENIRYATIAYGQNKATNGAGLCYKCNDFVNNSSDIRVLETKFPNPGEYVPQGIANNQGANIPGDPSSPAGNQFSYTGPEGTYTDINNMAEHFTYYYHEDQPLGVNLKPKYFSEKTVTIVGVNTPWNEESCSEGGGGGGGGKGKATANKAKADSVQNFISLIEDGGNPESLRSLVANSLPSQAYEVYTALMAQSPEVSDTTMAKAIEKENVLAPVMIRDIMAANPKSSKNDRLIEKLEERNQPLPDYMLGQILQGRSLGDFMSDLYAQRNAYRNAYHQGIEEIAGAYLADSLLSREAALDSAINLLQAQNDAYFNDRILTYTAARKDYSQVQELLSNQLDNPQLPAYQSDELQAWQDYYQIVAGIDVEPDSAQLAAFSELWLEDRGAASAAARAYLQTYNNLYYEEPLYTGDESYASSPQEHYQELVEKAKEHQYLSIAPNPAKDYFIVKYNLEKEYSDAIIRISNMQGIITDSKTLEVSKNQILIPTKDYPAGNYTLQLIFGKQIQETHKFTIVK